MRHLHKNKKKSKNIYNMQLLGVLASVEKHAVEKHPSGTSIVFASSTFIK